MEKRCSDFSVWRAVPVLLFEYAFFLAENTGKYDGFQLNIYFEEELKHESKRQTRIVLLRK